MSGNAVSRSLRGHLLVESSLISILLEELAGCQLIDLEPLKSFLEVIDEKSIDEINLLQKKMKELEQRSRTAKLWLLYIHYVRVLKNYIIADLWAMSLNDAAAVHQAMNRLARSTIKTTEQHVDLGHSRCIRDQEDWKRFKNWLLM